MLVCRVLAYSQRLAHFYHNEVSTGRSVVTQETRDRISEACNNFDSTTVEM